MCDGFPLKCSTSIFSKRRDWTLAFLLPTQIFLFLSNREPLIVHTSKVPNWQMRDISFKTAMSVSILAALLFNFHKKSPSFMSSFPLDLTANPKARLSWLWEILRTCVNSVDKKGWDWLNRAQRNGLSMNSIFSLVVIFQVYSCSQ